MLRLSDYICSFVLSFCGNQDFCKNAVFKNGCFCANWRQNQHKITRSSYKLKNMKYNRGNGRNESQVKQHNGARVHSCFCWWTMVGASTFISRQLNSKAKMGFDSITEMLRFLLWSPEANSVSELISLSIFDASTLAGDTALTLNEIKKQIIRVYRQMMLDESSWVKASTGYQYNNKDGVRIY